MEDVPPDVKSRNSSDMNFSNVDENEEDVEKPHYNMIL